jgi:two-component system cell cycle sensor histidine kinase/response regulator CckA
MQKKNQESLTLMATGIAHDFNNLIAAILGNAAIIAKGLPSDSPLAKNAKQIDTTARKALELTNQLQSFAGKGEFKLETLRINSAINEIAPRMKESVHGGISLKYALQDNLPAINADPSCLSQIILNLVINASDAILERDGKIVISTGLEVTDHIRRDNDCMDEIPHGNSYVYVEIKDSGCGMTNDVRSRIFDPFFTTKIRGHGLGLPVVLGIMRAHGGGIEINTAPGKGSTFRALFPAAGQ